MPPGFGATANVVVLPPSVGHVITAPIVPVPVIQYTFVWPTAMADAACPVASVTGWQTEPTHIPPWQFWPPQTPPQHPPLEQSAGTIVQRLAICACRARPPTAVDVRLLAVLPFW